MTGPRPEKTTAQKMRENVSYLRGKGASRERIQQEIDRWDAELQNESKNERKLSGAEKVAAVGSKLGSGATFGLLDEAVGFFDEDAKNEQRYLQKQLEEENPGVALAAEVAGGLAMPGSFLSAPAKLAKTATTAAKIGRAAKVAGTVIGEGAIQGGLSGAGNAEGSLEERLAGATKGGIAGGATAGLISGVGRGIGAARRAAAVRRGVHTPSLDELVLRTPDEDIAAARTRYSELQGRNLGKEATVADVLPQGEAALRAQATASKGTRTKVDATLRDRSTRLANTADDRLSQHTGTQRQSAAKTVDGIIEDARAKSRPDYEAGNAEAVGPVEAPSQARIDNALMLPKVQEYVGRAQKNLPYGASAEDTHGVLTQAYQEMGEDIRLLRDKRAAKTISVAEKRELHQLIQEQRNLREAIGSRSPSWLEGNEKFAGEMELKDAYEQGGKNTPADMIPSELKGMSDGEVQMHREGKVGTLRANVPNADLKEFARFSDVLAPVANREKAEIFKAEFGEKAYKEYLADLLEMAKLQRMKAGAGESSTVDKLIEQMQANPDLLGIAGQLASGNVGGAARGLVGKALDHTPLDRLFSSQKNASQNADFLLRSGDDVPKTLEEMIGLRAAAQKPTRGTVRQMRGRDGGYAGRGSNVAARTVGGIFGRN